MKNPNQFPPEWENLPDDQVTTCGVPLGYVYPDMYDENNQPRDRWHLNN